MRIRADIKADRLDCYQCEAARARDSTHWKNRWSISFDLVDAKDKGSKYLDFGIAYLYICCMRVVILPAGGVLVYSLELLEFRVCVDDHLWRCPLSLGMS